MLIGIDGNEANVEKRVGVSEFAYELIRNFFELRKKSANDHKFQIYLRKSPLPHMPKEEEWFKYQVVKSTPLWTQLTLPA